MHDYLITQEGSKGSPHHLVALMVAVVRGLWLTPHRLGAHKEHRRRPGDHHEPHKSPGTKWIFLSSFDDETDFVRKIKIYQPVS